MEHIACKSTRGKINFKVMADYNLAYINTHYALIEAFLFEADKNVLDISYSIDDKKMTIQVVLLDGFTLSQKWPDPHLFVEGLLIVS
jgi:hypothetical protein